MIPAPTLGPRYWLALCLSSALGANLGDVLSRELGLGYWRGLPVLVVLFALVVAAARLLPRTTAWYWLAIVLVRAAATNLSDLQILTPGDPPAVRSPLSFPLVILTWAIILAVLAWLGRDRVRDGLQGSARDGAGGDLLFWATMLSAGVLATATGDWLAFGTGLEPPTAAAISTLVLVVAFLALVRPAYTKVIAFWVLVVVIRNWGTNVGDALADAINLPVTTALSAVLTVAVLAVLGPPRRDQLATP